MNKKIPFIPPLLHNGKFIMNFKERLNCLMTALKRQCSLDKGNSKLSLSIVEFLTYDFLKIIRNLNPHKAHGHDISISMFQILFLSKLKKACLKNNNNNNNNNNNSNNNNQELKNYDPISLLLVSSKITERLLYDSMFKFFTDNSFISQDHQGSNQVTVVLTSSCQLRIKFTKLLVAVMMFNLYY